MDAPPTYEQALQQEFQTHSEERHGQNDISNHLNPPPEQMSLFTKGGAANRPEQTHPNPGGYPAYPASSYMQGPPSINHTPVISPPPPPPGFEVFCQQTRVNIFREYVCCLGPVMYEVEGDNDATVLVAESSIGLCQYMPSNYYITDISGNRIGCIDTTEEPFKISAPLGHTIGYIKLKLYFWNRKIVVMNTAQQPLFKINLHPTREFMKRRFVVSNKEGVNMHLPSSVVQSIRECYTFNLGTEMTSSLDPTSKVLFLHALFILHYCAERIKR